MPTAESNQSNQQITLSNLERYPCASYNSCLRISLYCRFLCKMLLHYKCTVYICNSCSICSCITIYCLHLHQLFHLVLYPSSNTQTEMAATQIWCITAELARTSSSHVLSTYEKSIMNSPWANVEGKIPYPNHNATYGLVWPLRCKVLRLLLLGNESELLCHRHQRN